jgi:hypothetical protein
MHFDRPVLLPHDLENYEGTYIVSPGRPGIPALLPSWSQADEKKVLDSLIRELNDKLLAGVDPDPNLSRSSKRPQLYPASAPAVSNPRHLSAVPMQKILQMRPPT